MSHNDILGELITPLTEPQARMYSPLTLAFLGDAVYSLLVRNMLTVESNKPAGKLHKDSIKFVNAAFQAQMIKELMDELSENEIAVFKRGRNAHSAHSPKNQSDADYRYATGFEALYGYLYLCGNTERIKELFNKSTLKAYKESAESSATIATEKASIASNKADIASTHAQIATEKAQEAVSTLASKANKDMDNLSTSGKAAIFTSIMPSNNYVDLTLPSAATDTYYTAPADGYFSLRIRTLTSCSSIVLNHSNGMRAVCFAPSHDLPCGAIMPVKKGDSVECYILDYSSNTTNNHFRFYYAGGAVS
jgi:ribonuclease-3 family protein